MESSTSPLERLVDYALKYCPHKAQETVHDYFDETNNRDPLDSLLPPEAVEEKSHHELRHYLLAHYISQETIIEVCDKIFSEDGLDEILGNNPALGKNDKLRLLLRHINLRFPTTQDSPHAFITFRDFFSSKERDTYCKDVGSGKDPDKVAADVWQNLESMLRLLFVYYGELFQDFSSLNEIFTQAARQTDLPSIIGQVEHIKEQFNGTELFKWAAKQLCGRENPFESLNQKDMQAAKDEFVRYNSQKATIKGQINNLLEEKRELESQIAQQEDIAIIRQLRGALRAKLDKANSLAADLISPLFDASEEIVKTIYEYQIAPETMVIVARSEDLNGRIACGFLDERYPSNNPLRWFYPSLPFYFPGDQIYYFVSPPPPPHTNQNKKEFTDPYLNFNPKIVLRAKIDHLYSELLGEFPSQAFPLDTAGMPAAIQDFSKIKQGKWRSLLEAHFSQNELHTLAFDLEIDYESFSAPNKQVLTLKIIEHMKHRNRLSELYDYCCNKRGNVNWGVVFDNG
ncbi:MAG: hypothetical protein KF770_15650 [Anaerolineae bacterium]|nr:hypothetical protein [Anaerolineae bacterium]